MLSTLAAGPFLGAQVEVPVERKPLRIIQTEEAVFPWMLSQQGITEGWAKIAITVDAEGTLLDALPVSYTRKPFADQAVYVLRRWRYEPTLIRGEPVGTQTEIVFNFQAVGVVVSFDTERYLNRFVEEKASYRPCSLRELDRVPTPIEAAAPVYSDQLADKGVVGQAVVEFYIDETGTVRVPAVVSADYTELGILAIAAVEGWKFEPPTSNNAPVLAKVRQTFQFHR
ncbi:MAG: TonB family protein [Opitutaceae bacterium]|nr:TonB family protein [Opitutaceae bacterium]